MHVSTGRYEGMWRDNLKDGLGVYTFPKAHHATPAAPLGRLWLHACCL